MGEESDELIEEIKEEEIEEKGFSLIAAQALRPKRGELEQLISSELALAVFSNNPLQKIRHVFEAYKLLPPEKRDELFSEEERDEFERLYEVCISFINTVPTGNGVPRFAGASPFKVLQPTFTGLEEYGRPIVR